jgi:polysaccharide export outer membrane protein
VVKNRDTTFDCTNDSSDPELLLRERLKYVALLLTVTVLTACGISSGAIDSSTAALSGSSTAHHLAPGDKLKISVFNEPDLTGDFAIDENGNIAFPLVGALKAAGLGVDELKTNLVEKLQGGFVRNPRVNIDVLTYRPINIIGEVKSAGQYPYRPGMTAQDVAAIAGGYTYRANENTLHVTRGSNKDQITVDLREKNIAIFPGDSIKISERYF